MVTSFRRFGLIFVALSLAACGPSIVVQNNTSFAVRAVVSNSGHSEVLSPSPGNSSYMAAEEGPYRASVIPDAEWLAYAKATRQFLNDELAQSDSLSGARLLEVIRRLKDIAAKIQQYESVTNVGSSCSGRISDADGAVTILIGSGGALVLSCK